MWWKEIPLWAHLRNLIFRLCEVDVVHVLRACVFCMHNGMLHVHISCCMHVDVCAYVMLAFYPCMLVCSPCTMIYCACMWHIAHACWHAANTCWYRAGFACMMIYCAFKIACCASMLAYSAWTLAFCEWMLAICVWQFVYECWHFVHACWHFVCACWCDLSYRHVRNVVHGKFDTSHPPYDHSELVGNYVIYNSSTHS